MKKLLSIALLSLLMVSFAFAGWSHDEVVLDFSMADSGLVGGTGDLSGEYWRQNSPHGIVVDGNGRIWVAFYSGYGNGANSGAFEFLSADEADTLHIKALNVFEEVDGNWQHAAFSPINFLEFPDGTKDTLHAESPTHNGSHAGLSMNRDGNIVLTSWKTVYIFDANTGQALDRWTAPGGGTMTEFVQEPVSGYYYGTHVVAGGRPMYILDENLDFVGNAIDSVFYILRSLIVRQDDAGTTHIYTGSTWNGQGVLHFASDLPGIDLFQPVDTLANVDDYIYYKASTGSMDTVDAKMWASSVDWTPDGNILIGALRITWAGPLGSKWWILDPSTNELVDWLGQSSPDSIATHKTITIPGGVNGPRGGSFADANTLYTVDFYNWTLDRWTYSTTAIEDVVAPASFKLSQNFPNPFNPVTTINYALDNASSVKLQVFNVRGQLIETLVDASKPAGDYTAVWNAADYASGNYIYKLTVNGSETMVKKMTLMK